MSALDAFLVEVTRFASVFWMTVRETAPYLILGLILAGILHVLVPTRIIRWAAGAKGFSGALRGALLGAPLPLCSCSVMPTMMALRRRGASLSSSFSFLIATPETSIDALAVTAALLPPVFLGLRPAAAILMAVLVGMLIEAVGTSAERNFQNKLKAFSGTNPTLEDEEACNVCGLKDDRHEHTRTSRGVAVIRYAFDEFFEDIGFWIFGGLFASALVTVLVPDGFLARGFWNDHPTLQILGAVLISIPIYSCATASTPMAAALLAKGLNPGAGLALLLAGPATNLGSLILISREFGKRVMVAYLFGMSVTCIAFGTILNMLWHKLPGTTGTGGTMGSVGISFPGWIEIASAWVLIALLARVIAKKLRHSDEDECCDHGHSHG